MARVRAQSVVTKSRRRVNLANAWCRGQRVVRVKDLNAFHQRLQLRRWQHIGSGAFGDAWGKVGLVWKVGDGRPNLDNAYSYCGGKREDMVDGYQAYAWSILQGLLGDSRFLPRMRLMLVADDGSYAVLMERLAVTYGDACRLNAWSVNVAEWDLRNSVTHARNISRGYDSDPDFKPIEPLRRIGERLHEWFIATGLVGQFDLHDQNWMLRSNGEIVLTDPLC